MTGKGVLIWTHPGSQGWRPVGGLVLHGALLEVGIPHRFVYGAADDPAEVIADRQLLPRRARATAPELSTIGTFGGRGMGQTCGVADPSQWMRMFGVDIDSRDTTELIATARAVTAAASSRPRAADQAALRRAHAGGRSRPSARCACTWRIKKLVAKDDWDFYTIQSFPGLGDDYTATCFAQSMMLEDGVGTSTLGDFNTA